MKRIGTFAASLFMAALLGVGFAQQAPTLDLTYTIASPNLQDMELFLARDQGLFKQDGVKVNISFVTGDTRGMQALLSHKADVADVSNQIAYTSIAKGAKIKIIANTDPVSDYVIVGKKSLNGLADLQGHVMGISTVGGLAQTLPEVALKLHNLDPNKVTWVSVGGSSARAQALVAGKIDAALVHALQANQLIQKNPQFHIVSNLAQQVPHYQFGCYVAREDTIQQKPEALAAFVKGMIQGKRLMLSNKELTLKDYYTYYPNIDHSIVSQTYDFLVPLQSGGLNGGMSKTNFDFTVKTLVQTGALKKPLAFNDAYDMTFVNQALQQLGTVSTSTQ